VDGLFAWKPESMESRAEDVEGHEERPMAASGLALGRLRFVVRQIVGRFEGENQRLARNGNAIRWHVCIFYEVFDAVGLASARRP
jgi:hypothetical protein